MDGMLYVGRIVCVARAEDGRWCAGYRVSSRSFPNRVSVVGENSVHIVPKPGHEADVRKNPYIAYTCARIVCEGRVAVVTNGSQTDPVAEKIAAGVPVRDALALALLALVYEKDTYNTPRIAAVTDTRGEGSGWLAVIRRDGLTVRQLPVAPGRFFYVATYEENDVDEEASGEFPAVNAEEACAFLLGGGVFARRANPVTAVAAVQRAADVSGFDLAVQDAAH